MTVSLALFMLCTILAMFVDNWKSAKAYDMRIRRLNSDYTSFFNSAIPSEFSGRAWYEILTESVLLHVYGIRSSSDVHQEITISSRWSILLLRMLYNLCATSYFTLLFFAEHGECAHIKSRGVCETYTSMLMDDMCRWEAPKCTFNTDIRIPSVINVAAVVFIMQIISVPLDTLFAIAVQVTSSLLQNYKNKTIVNPEVQGINCVSDFLSRQALIMLAARLAKMKSIMEDVSDLEETKQAIDFRNKFPNDQFEDDSSLLWKVRCSRSKADQIAANVMQQDCEYKNEKLILQCFICHCMESDLQKSIALKHFLRDNSIRHTESYLGTVAEGLVVLFLLAFIVLSLLYIFRYGAYMERELNDMWLLLFLVSICLDVIVFKPMRVWVTWIASASIVEEEAQVCLGILRERCQYILRRRAGAMVYANSWIQHFNPACRVARMFPHLPVSRLLMSLSDFDLPINYSVSTSSSWFQVEKWIYFSVCLVWPKCPLLLQDVINETIATAALCAFIFIPIYNIDFIVLFFVILLALCIRAFVLRSKATRANSFNAPIRLDISGLSASYEPLANAKIFSEEPIIDGPPKVVMRSTLIHSDPPLEFGNNCNYHKNSL
jgi:hypothetical protein